jgi:hypothetical protein
MRAAALRYLERGLRTVDDCDPEYRGPAVAPADGAVLAFERIGLLSSEEAARWCARFADAPVGRGMEVEPPLSDDARAAGTDHLGRLLARVPPFRRRPDAGEIIVQTECATAIETLRAVGALDEGEHADWDARLLAAEAPWLDEPLPPSGCGVAYAIEIRPESEEEAAEDAADQAAWEARPKAEAIRRVVVGSPERHAGLAMVAVCVHGDATSLHFHFLGGYTSSETCNGGHTRRSRPWSTGLSLPSFATIVAPRMSPSVRARSRAQGREACPTATAGRSSPAPGSTRPPPPPT